MSKQFSIRKLMSKTTIAALAFAGFTQDVNATELQQASLQTPSSARSYFTGITDTVTDGLSGDRSETTPYAIQSLARSLGAGRTEVSSAEYVARVFAYVRDNIETLPYYGVKKGALGAYYDNAGTAFDQAMLMVELLRADGLTADYKLGEVTLNATQFENMFGITDDTAATQVLADGGIPATVSSSGGLVTSVTMEHAWVYYNSTNYDVAYKVHTSESGINIGTAMSGGGTTYSRANFETDVAMNTTAYAWGNAYHDPDIATAESDMVAYASNLVTAFKDTHYQKSMDEIIGGRYLDPEDQGSLSYGTLTAYKTITGDIPDEYRTAINIQYGNIDKTVFADEIYGLRFWVDGNDLRAGNATIATNTGTATTLTIDIDHPYAADSGNYADHNMAVDMADLDSAAIVFATGSYSNQSARHVVNGDYQNSIVNDDDAPDTETMARLTLAANWQVQLGQLMNMNAALASVTYQHHDSIGVIVSDGSDNISINVDTNMSVNADNADSDERRAAYATLQSVGDVFKSSLVDQARGTGADTIRTSTSMIVEALDDPTLEIWEMSKYAVSLGQHSNLTGYDSGLVSDIATALTNSSGYTTAYLMVDDKSGLSGTADADPYVILVDETNGTVQPMINDIHGAYGTATEIGTAGDLLGGNAGDIVRDNSPQAVSGEYGDSATDITIGSGSFPMSLPFTRSFQISRLNGGGKGWMHNYDITGKVTSNPLVALSNPIAAAQAIATLKVVNDLHVANLDSQSVLTAMIAENWLRNQLVDNTFTIRTAGGSDFYYKLSDGTYEALSGSLATLSYVGGGTDEYTVTALSDSTMTFENVATGEYRIKEMTWPDGMEVSFTYTTGATYKITVANNIGHSLEILDGGSDGTFEQVQDNTGRRTFYTWNGTTGFLEYAEIETFAWPATSEYGAGAYEVVTDFDLVANGTTHGWDVKVYDPVDTAAPIVTHTINRLGQMEKSVDRQSNDSYFYPSQRRGETVSVTGGISTSYTNHQGLTYRTVNALGQEATSTFYGNGLLKRATAPEGNAIEYSYNKYGQKTKERVYANNGSGGTDGSEYLDTDYGYDTLANRLQLLTVTTPDVGLGTNHNVTTFQYDSAGFITKRILPNVDVWNPGSSSNVKERPEYVYVYKNITVGSDTIKRLDTIETPDDTIEKRDYDLSTSLVNKVTRDYGVGASFKNITGEFIRDYIGKVKTKEDHRSNEVRSAYYVDGKLKSTYLYGYQVEVPTVWWGDGTITYTTENRTYGDVEYTYDAAGRITKVRRYKTSSLYQDSFVEYDNLGRIYKTKDHAGDETVYSYTEALGSPITVTAPGGFTNPVAVSMVEVTDPVGRKVRAYTDILGRTVRTITAYNTADEYTEDRGYDDAGQLGWVKDGNGNVTKYTYDVYGRAKRTTYPDTTWTEASNYDDHGQPGTLTKRDGSTFTLTYDAHGRIQKRVVKNSGATTERTYDFGFDNMGRTIMAKVTKGADVNTVTMTYDELGRKASEQNDDGYGVIYAYDEDAGEVEITYDDPGFSSDTYKVTRLMDERGLITSVTENRNSTDYALAFFTYDEMGRMLVHSTGADRDMTYTYEYDGDLDKVVNELSSSLSTVDYDYAYNDAGQVTTKTISSALYKWSPSENDTITGSVNNMNQVTTYDGGSVTWDDNGNLTSRGNRDLTWSIENYLEEVEESSVTIAEYKYDALGRRVEKIAGGDTTRYIYDGGNVIAEFDLDGATETLLRRYVYGPGVDRPVAMITKDGSGIDREYYHYDGQGSVIAMVDDGGNVTGSYAYDPYGKVDTINGTSGNVYRYTGRRLDAETGYYYYRARYYDSDMGRFLSSDPIGYGDGLNMYAYVKGDPVNINDPFGLDAPCDPGRCHGYGRSGLQGSAATYNSGFWGMTNNEKAIVQAEYVLRTTGGEFAVSFRNADSAARFSKAITNMAPAGQRITIYSSNGSLGRTSSLTKLGEWVTFEHPRGVRRAFESAREEYNDKTNVDLTNPDQTKWDERFAMGIKDSEGYVVDRAFADSFTGLLKLMIAANKDIPDGQAKWGFLDGDTTHAGGLVTIYGSATIGGRADSYGWNEPMTMAQSLGTTIYHEDEHWSGVLSERTAECNARIRMGMLSSCP